jgi:hypothetical protein
MVEGTGENAGCNHGKLVHGFRVCDYQFENSIVYMTPDYLYNISGCTPVDIEFDNALELMFQNGYKLLSYIDYGSRVTNIKNVNNSVTLDTSSFGVYF